MLKFEWDDQKHARNIKKHKVTFYEATEVLEEGLYILKSDTSHSDVEDRFIVIGPTKNKKVLFVVFVEKIENHMRIISARKATQKEKVMYEKSR